MKPALSSAFSPSLSSAFKRNILKKTLFPDYRALYCRTRKYKFWPRHPKSYFRSFPYSNVSSSSQGHWHNRVCYALVCIGQFNLSDVDSCKNTNRTLKQTFMSLTWKFNMKLFLLQKNYWKLYKMHVSSSWTLNFQWKNKQSIWRCW